MPNLPDQCLFLYNMPGVFDEHPQHGEGFQRQMNRLVRAEQYPFAGV